MNKIDEIALRVADKHDPRGNYFPYRNDLLLYVKELLAELSNEELSIRVENARLRAALSDLLEFAIDSTCGKQHAVAGAREALKGQP